MHNAATPLQMDAEDVSRFVSLTNCPADQAQFYLEANNGNFDGAVAMFYGVSGVDKFVEGQTQ